MQNKNKSKTTPRGMYKRCDVWYSRITGAYGKLIRKRLSTNKATAALILAEMRKTVDLQKAGILPANVAKTDADLKELRDKFLRT